MKNLILFLLVLVCFGACKKHEDINPNLVYAGDSSLIQINYLKKIKTALKDSLSKDDFTAINFNKVLKSKDAGSKNYFLRVGFIAKPIATDFLLLKTDSKGNILKARIIHVNKKNGLKPDLNADDISFSSISLNRKHLKYIDNKHKGENKTHNLLMTTLPDVVVTGYIYSDNGSSWFMFDALIGSANIPPSGIYTYGVSNPSYGGGSIMPDETIDISYENDDESAIDINKYLNCFSSLSDQGATFKITILTDLPVNNDPSRLFDFKTGACGHSFIQLNKSNGGTSIQQTIGFYPQSGWKSIEANSPVASKIADNEGHEFNAELTVSVDATHFQNALNNISYYSQAKYDIDNFNCTDFALNVFNAVAPTLLSIPQYHIPGGMYGEVSNTPQGLYNELSTLSKGGGYSGGDIQIPGVAGYTGSSHGPCD